MINCATNFLFMNKFKKLLLLVMLYTHSVGLFADEGMWILSLLQKKEADMKAKGLKLNVEDIYRVNQSSLKDAIVWFNGGCTGEIISSNGLVLTNHHCGYDAIAALSTPQKNILDSGFYAGTHSDELKPAKPMFVSILQSIHDVTARVMDSLALVSESKPRELILNTLRKDFKNEFGGNEFLDVRLYDMFKGNQFFVFVYQRFTDIRLVGTPPQSVGKFGFDTDNWEWPRHTGDFSLFRIYANTENKPAHYSKENVPFKPQHHLPINAGGVKEGDYAMIIGFPGTTNRYEFASAIQLDLDEKNYSIVDMRTIRLEEWKKVMDKDLETRLKLSGNYASIANYWKYFRGEAEQLVKNNVVEKKREEEAAFLKWAKGKPDYSRLFADADKAVQEVKPVVKQLYYLNQGLLQTKMVQMHVRMRNFNDSLISKSKQSDSLRQTIIQFMEKEVDWNPLLWEADQEMLKRMLTLYITGIPEKQHQPALHAIAKKYKFNKVGIQKGVELFVNEMFAKSPFTTKDKALKFVSKMNAKSLSNQSMYQLTTQLLDTYNEVLIPAFRKYNQVMGELGSVYVRGLMESQPNRLFYPDANSSIRLTYGSVEGYNAKDGVYYKHYTTMEGVMDKYVPGDYEFNLTQDFIDLQRKRHYGPYADKEGKLVVNFLSNNDITGGNSGSPVMDGEGNLIGLAFDGNWEAMSGNIYFDPTYKRTINVDIRYVLWCIDILGKAPHIIKELTLVK
jgi:hypothetical protein